MRTYPLNRYLDTNGDGTGTIVANGNYSGAVEEFYVEAQDADVLEIHRLIVHVEDSTGMTAAEYGNLGAPLSVGVEIKLIDTDGSTVISDLTDGVPIKTNAQWARLCFDVDVKSWGVGPDNDYLTVRWTFARSGTPITLKPGQSLRVYLNDSLTGLIDHTFMVQGFAKNKES